MSQYVKLLGLVGGISLGLYKCLIGDPVSGVGLITASLGSATALSK